MTINLRKRGNLSDGEYISKISSVSDVSTSNGERIVIDFVPKDEDGNICESVKLWVSEDDSSLKLLLKLLDVIGSFTDEGQVSTEELREELLNETVGVVVKVKEKGGNTYFNIADFFETDEEFDDGTEYEESDDGLEDEEEEDEEEDDDDELEEDEEEEEDDDDPEIKVYGRNRSDRRNKGRNNRR